MPWSENRKRPFSAMMDIYAGPEDFMEAGARGFLITTLPEREEPAIDQAMKMLRKACVKLYGGTKPQVKSTTALFSNGYIAVDFMDPDAVTVLPNPELKTNKTAKDQEEVKKEEEDTEKTEKNDKDTENIEMEEKEAGDKDKEDEKEDEPSLKKDSKKEEEMEKEGGDTEEQDVDMEADKSVDKSTNADDGAPEQESPKTKQESKEDGGEKKKEGDDAAKDDKKNPDKRGDSGKSKADAQKSKSSREDERRKRDNKRKRREMDTTPKWPLMKAPYKFKAFRTELRHIMFIKSNIPDPLVLINEIMDLLVKRKPLKSDSINQLLPIQGICNYSYWELEVMARRVLAPFFPEDVEEPPSFAILLYDKLSEPGADVLPEILRSSIWSINPMAWQTSPLSEADVTIHLELIGSKIILSAMTHYMKYRQYSPFCVAEMGEGKPEDPEEQEKRRTERERSERSDRSDRKGRSRSRSDKPPKTEETPSGKGKEKDKDDDSHDKEDSKKDEKEKTEETVKEEIREVGGEKPQEEATEPVTKEEEAADSNDKGWRKTRRGKRGGSQKRKN